MKQYFISLIIFFESFIISHSSMVKPDEIIDPYIFYVGQNTMRRIDFDNQLLLKKSCEHLDAAKLTKGQVVWDIGCGNGAFTVHLARSVGQEGHVYAFDKSLEQIYFARHNIKAAGLSNVTLIHTDITAPDQLPRHKPDLIYMRHVLMHIKQPKIVIKFLKNLLKVNGVIVSQEPILSTSLSSIDDDILKKYYETLVGLGKKLGVDYDIGYQLRTIFHQAGFLHVKDDFSQPHINLTDAIQPLILGLNEWSNQAIQLKLTTPDKINCWITTFKNWTDGENSVYLIAEQIHVIAYN